MPRASPSATSGPASAGALLGPCDLGGHPAAWRVWMWPGPGRRAMWAAVCLAVLPAPPSLPLTWLLGLTRRAGHAGTGEAAWPAPPPGASLPPRGAVVVWREGRPGPQPQALPALPQGHSGSAMGRWYLGESPKPLSPSPSQTPTQGCPSCPPRGAGQERGRPSWCRACRGLGSLPSPSPSPVPAGKLIKVAALPFLHRTPGGERLPHSQHREG